MIPEIAFASLFFNSILEEGEKIHLVRCFTEQEEAMQVSSAILSRIREEGAQYDNPNRKVAGKVKA